ncbi:MAG: homogentisate 1,2-dioxygenase [Actinobacteria bacterium]|nr:homogentisate 1,2-dioxygenase [Actinomycetota bacterium]
MNQQPNIDLYTRNGFAGPATTLVRRQYAPGYTRVEGSYVPRRFNTSRLDPHVLTAPRALPLPLLEGDGVQVCAWWRNQATEFAIRNVHHDELHFVLSGRATLETDFGALDVRPGDFVLIPRAVSYRLTGVEALRELIVSTRTWLRVEPEVVPAVLNVDLHVDAPQVREVSGDPVPDSGEYELVVRHGKQTTSYFYDYDPLSIAAVVGHPVVRRFNLENVQGLAVANGGLQPSRLINDDTTNNLVFYLGSRRSDRPPVHHNADYDEVIVFASGPGHYGAIDVPGTITWTPKGIIHQGPDEDMPEGYVAWLLETRSDLHATPEALRISQLMETSQFGVHPTDTTEAV